jgi:hypothetical protein
VLLDLGFKITPDKKTEINAIMRLRSQLGSFYAAGDESLLRWVYIKGVIAKTVNYEVGDIRLQLSPYTMYNNESEGQVNEASVFRDYRRDLVYYENFNKGNSWWQQGAHTDFAIGFNSKLLDQMKFDVFFVRNRNNSTLNPASFQVGGRASVLKTSRYNLSANYLNLYDIGATLSPTASYAHNPVTSFELNAVLMNKATMRLSFFGEGGFSSVNFFKDALAPTNIRGAFGEGGLLFEHIKSGLSLRTSFRNVDPYFFSAGAQSKRVNFATNPNQMGAFPIFGNDPLNPNFRFVGLFDMVHDPRVMNTQIGWYLMSFNPMYGNATPYGVATPNRRGLDASLSWKDKKERADATFGGSFLQEAVLAGSATDKRKFVVMTAAANLYLNKIIGWDKKVLIHGGTRIEQTNRPGIDSIDYVQLSTMLVDAGIEVEVFKKLDLLAGIKMNTVTGNEFIAIRDQYGVTVNWDASSFYNMNATESLVGYGAKYRFSNTSYITFQHHLYDYNDKTYTNRSVKFDRFSLMFNLNY